MVKVTTESLENCIKMLLHPQTTHNPLPVDQQVFDEIGAAMVEGIQVADGYARDFQSQHVRGLNKMSKIHIARSHVVNELEKADPSVLALMIDHEVNLGKVQAASALTGTSYRLRARSGRPPLLDPKKFPLGGQGSLFNVGMLPTTYMNPDYILEYALVEKELVLSAARACVISRKGKRTFRLLEDMQEVGTYPLLSTPTQGTAFSQGSPDEFDEIAPFDLEEGDA